MCHEKLFAGSSLPAPPPAESLTWRFHQLKYFVLLRVLPFSQTYARKMLSLLSGKVHVKGRTDQRPPLCHSLANKFTIQWGYFRWRADTHPASFLNFPGLVVERSTRRHKLAGEWSGGGGGGRKESTRNGLVTTKTLWNKS